MNPILTPDLYDSIIVDGDTSPGQVTLSGHDRNESWDVKKADGKGGASTTYKGEDVAQFSASFYLVYDPILKLDEFALWETFSAKLRASLPAAGKPKALLIYHPDLVANGIVSVCVASIGGMAHDGKGGATVVVKFLEYRPAKSKGGSPSGPKATSKKTDPNADVKAELASLVAKAKSGA